jgi:uncharacterized protein YbjT (DUF2867 family)
MQPRVVTIFGGTGFIGRHVIRRLAKTGARIRVATRSPLAARFLKTAGDVGQIVPLSVRLEDDAAIAAAISGSDTVINLLGVLYEKDKAANSFQTMHAVVPTRIARLAAAAGVQRLVHVSAIGADAASASAYARSKALGESGVRGAFADAVILRPSVVFGPEDNFFNRFAAMAKMAPFLPTFGGGQTRFQPVYVGDVADAVMKAVTAGDLAGRTFELGGPRIYTFKELMELVLRVTARNKAVPDLPWAFATAVACASEMLSGLIAPVLTKDQIVLLKQDNVVADGAAGLAELGIEPALVEVIVPTYLDKYRLGGRFTHVRTV